MNQFALYDSPGGALIADYSHKIEGLTVGTGPRGFAEARGFIPMPLGEAFMLYDRASLPYVRFSDNTTGALYEGRLEDVNIVSDGVKIGAFGYARAFSDIPYTAMWSVTNLETFTPEWSYGPGNPDNNRKWDIRVTNGQIVIGLVKNTIYAGAAAPAERGELRYQIPSGSGRQIVGIQADFSANINANVTLRISRYNASATFPYYTFQSNIASRAGIGAVDTYNFVGSFTGCDIVAVGLEATANFGPFAGETGSEYVKISNLRLVTDTSRQINTTLTVARTNGTAVTVTVGSTASMYVGQRLFIQGGGKNESTVVLSIPSSTTFTADIANAPGGGYPIGTLVLAWLIYADTIASDLITTTRATNSAQLASSTALIQSPGIDLLDETYEDRAMDGVLDYLASLGDTSGRQWEWGVYEGRALYLRPQNSAGRTWYIDLSDIDIDRTLDQLYNSVYAVYDNNANSWLQDRNVATLRTATTTDTTSVTRYGITRRKAIEVSTTNTNVAGVQRDTALSDTKDPPPRSSVVLSRVYDQSGALWPLTYVRSGDTVVLRNLPPTLSTTIDRIRSFRLTRTEYSADTNTLKVEPETPLPHLDSLLARLAIGLTAS